ncbi:MAG: hypothetical protein BroJett031_03500 [Betaproteobacteria bacterium]|nr:MAG: hypothetical protein BroJett031_03500 [Betaproteobacteria bacterium]
MLAIVEHKFRSRTRAASLALRVYVGAGADAYQRGFFVHDRFSRWSTAFWRGVIIAFFALTALVLLEESRAADASAAAARGIPASR